MDEDKMGFLEHLDELRKRIIIVLLSLTLTTTVSYFFSFSLFSFIKIPAGDIKFVYLSPFEPFMVRIKIALFSGIILSLPIILYEALAFLIPGLTKRERKLLLIILFSFIFLFIFGSFFSFFFILPFSLKWLFAQAGGKIMPNIRAEYYITFVGWFILIFGLIFEAPLLIISLVKLKLCTYKSLRQQWRIVYLAVFIASALITPDWNPITMLLMAAPLILLYEATLFAVSIFKLT